MAAKRIRSAGERPAEESRVAGSETPSAKPGDEVGLEPPTSTAHFAVVGIGASAGGLEAYGELLRSLPPDTGLAFVLVQHLDPSHASMLTALLARTSPMPVHEVRDGVRFAPNCVYVIPPNTVLAIDDGALRLSPRPDTRGAPMPIDYFFRSLAEHLGSMAIGVVLSGTGTDGAAGLAEIKTKGGVTFAQDEQTATYSGMPRAAVQAGAVDFVLAPAAIAWELTRIARFPGTFRDAASEASSRLDERGADLRRLLSMVKQATGADLSFYKPPTLLRRLARRMLVRNVATLDAYVQ
jgi:two-component system, chemotaxis family, CheB/CheR fusion protein